MNIFFREVKYYIKSLVFWIIGIIILIASSLAKFSAYAGTETSMNEIVSKFPQSVQAIFGLNGFDLNTASGYIGVMFLYIALMATIHAVLLGSNIISKEENEKTYEFLFTKPVSRIKIIIGKMFAGITMLIILNISSFLSSLFFINYFTKDNTITKYNIDLTLGLLIMQLLFFFVGIMIASVSKKPKSSTSIATSILLFSYLITFMININKNLDFLRILSPFKYFDANEILLNSSLNLFYVFFSILIIAISIFLSFKYYKIRDLK